MVYGMRLPGTYLSNPVHICGMLFTSDVITLLYIICQAKQLQEWRNIIKVYLVCSFFQKSGLKKADLTIGSKVESLSFLSATPLEIKLKVDDRSEVALPKDHLSDFRSISNNLMEVVKSTENASVLDGVVVYGQDKKEKKTVSF